MNEKPTPSDAVIDVFARTLFDDEHAHCGCLLSWATADDSDRAASRGTARTLLAVAMPQLSADVLRHAALELQAAQSAEWTARDVVGWLRHQAEAVLT